MRAGKLVNVIQIQRFTSEINDVGTPVEDWRPHKCLRAEVLERTASEFMDAQGAGDRSLVVFRTRYASDITNADRVQYNCQDFNIKEITQIGRKKGLELRCEKLGSD